MPEIHERRRRRLYQRRGTTDEDERTLLVLDNCEHLVEGCAVLADTLLRACPDLVILATSREPSRIAGEATWPAGGMSVPGP